ncbi:phosphoadenosine phosphosulfate reductase [Evansella vedderi]|uniref:Adenosine 5'-phosphosulfate reductase n=1 Tax=Evansella vedderi TaxID=38282 RepID=A0ABT9ZZD5_9BACI|nr:phosphoadenylyl-sulfate reductase [Evansella vedderi]MDQ0256604.1 phosphoadenosine phosphosulfate reductase [Evansella vedderi]
MTFASKKPYYDQLTEEDYAQLNEKLGKTDTLGVIKWAYETYGDELVYACSFGAEGIVLIDLISKVKRDANIVFLDTHLHFQETYDLIEKVKAKYPDLQIHLAEPEISLEAQREEYGEKLWERDPDLCCKLRKNQPLKKALFGKKAWVSGLRREQSPTRANTQFVNKDHKFQAIKICPLIHWTWDEVWQYIKLFQLPYNVLHDQSYPSIGCSKCTFPVAEGEDLRSGRWTGLQKTECGLHTK